MKTLSDYCPSNNTLEQYVLNVINNLREFTADDLHVLETEITDNRRDRRVIGSILKNLENKGYISKLYYVKSKRDECHGRPIMKWKVL